MTAGSTLPLAALRDRERHSAALFARRASQARAHKVVKDSTRAFLASFATDYLSGSGLPPEFLQSLAETKAAGTWDAYVGAARPWSSHAASLGIPAIPADPVRFACWLAVVGRDDRSYKPTKTRCCAIDALSALANEPPLSADARIAALRSLFARTKTYRRGRAAPVLRAEIPAVQMDRAFSPPRAGPSPRRFGRGGPSPNTRQRRLGATAAHMALLFDGALRYDDTREGQLGDLSFYPDAVEVGIFGSKTDPFREGQTAQLPPPADAAPGPASGSAPPSGASALLEVTRHGLRRLLALEPALLSTLASRLAASFPHDAPTPSAMSTWPEEVRALALPLYAQGLLVHCLPYYGSWLWEPLTADSNLAATLSTQQFADLAKRALAAAGHPTSGVGAHSLRRGGAAELAHGGLDLATLSLALRHASVRSTTPYVFQSVLTSATAGAMSGAARRSQAVGRGGASRGLPRPDHLLGVPAPRGHLSPRSLRHHRGLVHGQPGRRAPRLPAARRGSSTGRPFGPGLGLHGPGDAFSAPPGAPRRLP